MSKLVVKKHRPLKSFFTVLLLSIIFSTIIWILLDVSHWNFIRNGLSQNRESQRLFEINYNLESENTKLKEKIIKLERLTQVDTNTVKRLQNDIRSLQDQIFHLNEELKFYQGIMSTAADSKNLNIQGLHIEATEQEQTYRFKLVLTNVTKSDKVIEVTIDISVEGINETGIQVLPMKDVVTGNGIQHDIKFKNFVRVGGSLSFPEGFRPLKVIVDLRQKGRQKLAAQKTFEWLKTLSKR